MPFLLSALAIALLGAPITTTELAADRFGPWRLGMTRDAVTAITDHGPYTPVHVTGGLETKNGQFRGLATNVSFVFDDQDHLKLIQVWSYEGPAYSEAVEAWHAVYRHLVEGFGPVRLGDDTVPSDLDDPGALATWLPPEFQKPHETIDFEQLADGAQIQLHPLRADLRLVDCQVCDRVYGSFIRQPELGRYLVFLFVRTAGT